MAEKRNLREDALGQLAELLNPKERTTFPEMRQALDFAVAKEQGTEQKLIPPGVVNRLDNLLANRVINSLVEEGHVPGFFNKASIRRLFMDRAMDIGLLPKVPFFNDAPLWSPENAEAIKLFREKMEKLEPILNDFLAE